MASKTIEIITCDFCKQDITNEKPTEFITFINPAQPGPQNPQPRFIKLKIESADDLCRNCLIKAVRDWQIQPLT